MLEIGKKVPAFSLPDQDGKTVRLADFKGRKLLLFAFPKAATGGCTTQACGFRDNYPALEAAGAAVLGISPDPLDKLKKWQVAKGFPYQLLSDPDHQVLAAYGAWGEKKLYGRVYEGVIRSHWIIDEQGKLLDQRIKVSPTRSIELATDFLSGD